MISAIAPNVLANLKKESIYGRHWSVDDSNERFYTQCRPDLMQQYKYIKRKISEYFQQPRLSQIYEAETLYTPDGKVEEVRLFKPTCDCDDFIYEYGKHTGVRISALLVNNIFKEHRIKLWPNGAHMAPDYHIEIFGKRVNVEIKSVLVQDSGARISAQYNNAVHNKTAVERDLTDVTSEFCSTFCVFIYYYVDVPSRMVALFDADVVAMPLCLDYKVCNNTSIGVRQKSDGPNAINTSATVGVRIRGKWGKYNTLFDMYYSFLSKQPCVKDSPGTPDKQHILNNEQEAVKMRLKKILAEKRTSTSA